MSNITNQIAQGFNPFRGMVQGIQDRNAMAQQNAMMEENKRRNKFAEDQVTNRVSEAEKMRGFQWIAGLPDDADPQQAIEGALSTGIIKTPEAAQHLLQNFKVAQMNARAMLSGADGGDEYFGVPIPTDSGDVYLPNKRGGTKKLEIGGSRYQRPIVVNSGNQTDIIDPYTRQPTNVIPKSVPPEKTPQHRRDVKVAEAEADASVPSEQTRAKARDKLRNVEIIKKQLSKVQYAFDKIKDSASAGPFGQGSLPTPGGQSFDAAVDILRNYIRQMTRTPGEGSMSDFETRLAQAMNPDRTKYETVTQQQIDQIVDLVDTIEGGYGDMKPGGATPITQTDIDAAMRKYGGK